jgi:hypothetical protein
VPLDAILLAPVLSKLIGLGLSAWTAHGKQELGPDDVKAVQSLIDAGAGVAGLGKGDGNQRIGALHFVLVTRAFGEALKRHWYNDEHFAPGPGWWAWLKNDDFGRARMTQIEERMRIAAPRPKDVGGLPAAQELDVLTSLMGDPLGTPYYRRLWNAFADPGLLKTSEEPLIVPDRKLQFERHVRLAHALVSLGDRRVPWKRSRGSGPPRRGHATPAPTSLTPRASRPAAASVGTWGPRGFAYDPPTRPTRAWHGRKFYHSPASEAAQPAPLHQGHGACTVQPGCT